MGNKPKSYLETAKVGLRSLQENIDASSSGGACLVFHVFGALAEFGRNLM